MIGACSCGVEPVADSLQPWRGAARAVVESFPHRGGVHVATLRSKLGADISHTQRTICALHDAFGSGADERSSRPERLRDCDHLVPPQLANPLVEPR